MMRDLHCAHVLTAAGRAGRAGGTIRIDGERIAAVEPHRAASRGRCWRCRPFANAHDHARTVRSSSYGAAGKPLETWLHYLALLPSVDPYLASRGLAVAQRAGRRGRRDGALHAHRRG